jgi:flagellar biosynthesis/type III secretory pathway protein FliH
MSGTITIGFDRPVTSVQIIDQKPENRSQQTQDGAATLSERQSNQKQQDAEIARLCQTLRGLVEKISRFYDDVLAKHKEEIARLSVEIARKILMHKIQKGDYEIESILKEALKNAPTHQDLVVHLNPVDLARCQKLQQDEADSPASGGQALAQIQFVADPNIGPAECLLESPKGIVRSFIDEHIERISEALEKVR